MIDHIKLKGQSTYSRDDLYLCHKAGTTLYTDTKFDKEASEVCDEKCVIKFKIKKAWCRYYEKRNLSSGECKTDYNIWGSLQRFVIGKSYTDFYYRDIPNSLIEMCKECHFNISKPHQVRAIEIGINMTTSCDPDDFLSIFKLYWGGGFHEMRVLSGEDRPHGIERVMSDMYKIKIYNKTIYAERVEKLHPPKNRLRVEVLFMSRAIKKYGLPNTIQDLCDITQFQKYVNKFCEIVENICTADRLYISDLKGRDLRDYLLLHSDVRLYHEYMRRIKGDRKAIELEKRRCDKINALLAGRKTLKDEFVEKFDAKVRKLMLPKRV